MADVRHLFSTPLVVDTLQSEAGIAALRQAIVAEQARDGAGVQVSNIGGWHSNLQMLDWGGEAAKALVHKAMTMADEQTIDTRPSDAPKFDWVPEMWANVSAKGNANQYHFHPGCYWSAVAYIDDGYNGDGDSGLGGELQFMDPRMPAVRMAAPFLRNKDDKGNSEISEPFVRPRTGLIVMFPSWLQHSVRAFRGAGTRISIAINLIPAIKAK